MNPSKFLAGCVFDDELGLETNADRLEGRVNAILKRRPEDWLRGLPQIFFTGMEGSVGSVTEGAETNAYCRRDLRISLGHKAAEEADQMSYPELPELSKLGGCAYQSQQFQNWDR